MNPLNHTGFLHFPMTFSLLVNLSWVDLGTKVNLIFFNFSLVRNQTDDLVKATCTAVEYASHYINVPPICF